MTIEELVLRIISYWCDGVNICNIISAIFPIWVYFKVRKYFGLTHHFVEITECKPDKNYAQICFVMANPLDKSVLVKRVFLSFDKKYHAGKCVMFKSDDKEVGQEYGFSIGACSVFNFRSIIHRDDNVLQRINKLKYFVVEYYDRKNQIIPFDSGIKMALNRKNKIHEFKTN